MYPLSVHSHSPYTDMHASARVIAMIVIYGPRQNVVHVGLGSVIRYYTQRTPVQACCNIVKIEL
jgi:hypothetical protein